MIEELHRFVEHDPMSAVLASFLAGLLFSGISWGIVYVILFLLIWEVIYFGYLDVNGRKWDMNERVTLVLAAFLGFLTGAFFHDNDDHYEAYKKFKQDVDNYGKEFEWFY